MKKKLKTNEELRIEILIHQQNVIALFREGQLIHKAYLRAPEKQNLIDEVTRFMAKLSEGISEINKTIELQNQLLEKLNKPV